MNIYDIRTPEVALSTTGVPESIWLAEKYRKITTQTYDDGELEKYFNYFKEKYHSLRILK